MSALAACAGHDNDSAARTTTGVTTADRSTAPSAVGTAATAPTSTTPAPAHIPAPSSDTTRSPGPVTPAPTTTATPIEMPATTPLPHQPSAANAGPGPSPGPGTVERRSGPDGFSFDVARIDHALRQRIEPTSWRPGCPVPLDELRYLRLSHHGFSGASTTGELIVHRDHVEAMFQVFSALWTARFPIRSMRLIDDFGGDDYRSIEADNTSAFNCRFVEGTSRWSNHATGAAIDINPLENPYVSGGGTSHPASIPFLTRQSGTGVILEGGPVVAAFDAVGWDWGGRWGDPLDFQHFSAVGG